MVDHPGKLCASGHAIRDQILRLKFVVATRAIGFAVVLGMGLSACAQVPTAAVSVNQHVTTGISTLQENANVLIASWEESAFMLLDEHWEKVYSEAEKRYRDKKKIAACINLLPDQQVQVAGLAVLIRDEARSKIRTKAKEIRNQVNANAKKTLEANKSITALLRSVNQLVGTRTMALKMVGDLVSIAPVESQFLNTMISQ